MTALEHRPSASDLLERIPESVVNNEADARSWIRKVFSACKNDE